MTPQQAGNDLKRARAIALKASPTSLLDRVSKTDLNDYYKFRLRDRSRIHISLTGLMANANLELLNQKGRRIQASVRKGTQSETIQRSLQPGIYYIRVSRQQGTTRYRLQTSSRSLPSFKIQFDYRFDTANWFTQKRRAVLEAAADQWERAIASKFNNISAGAELRIVHPETGALTDITYSQNIDDLVIFVGTRSLDGPGRTLATGGPIGKWEIGSNLDDRYNGSRFQPWTAYLSFDRAEHWFFDPTPRRADDLPSHQHDFFSVALHELGHTLGIGTSNAFYNQISNNQFMGIQARAQNKGQPIPLSNDLAHPQQGFIASELETEAAMNSSLSKGERRLLNPLDLAFLKDIGYRVL